MIRTDYHLAALFAATPAAAQSFQSTDAVDKAVAGFTGTASARMAARAPRSTPG